MSTDPTPYESAGTPCSSKARIFDAVNPPDTTIRTCGKPARSSASRTLSTRRQLTPRGSKSPISPATDRSTMVPEVSRRTPHRRSPSARATAREVATLSLSKSTSDTMRTSSDIASASDTVAATVSPPHAAISAWGTVPIPDEPHQEACASVDTPIAPATCAAQPSPVCTIQWSWRAGKNMTDLGHAASTTARVLVAMRVRRASTPAYSVSRCAKAGYGPVMNMTVSHGRARSPSRRERTSMSPKS